MLSQQDKHPLSKVHYLLFPCILSFVLKSVKNVATSVKIVLTQVLFPHLNQTMCSSTFEICIVELHMDLIFNMISLIGTLSAQWVISVSYGHIFNFCLTCDWS